MSSGLPGHFIATARNNAWSNHRLLPACEARTSAEFAAPRTGFFPSLRATFNHILMVDLYYIDALEGLDALRRYSEPDLDFANARSMREAQRFSARVWLAPSMILKARCRVARPVTRLTISSESLSVHSKRCGLTRIWPTTRLSRCATWKPR